MTEEQDFLKFLEKLAKQMGLDDSNFVRDIKIGWVDCLTTKKTHWENCNEQQRRQHFLYWIIAAEEAAVKTTNPRKKRAVIMNNKIFKSYTQQYRSDIKD